MYLHCDPTTWYLRQPALLADTTMAQAAGRTNHNSHNDSTMQAFTDANNAAVQAAKDIRDLVDARDENDLWDESEEDTLDDLMVTLTRKNDYAMRRGGHWS